jgi:hypothetical protein
MALINTTTTGILGTTVYGDGAGALTVQKDGVTQGVYGNIPAFSANKSASQTGVASAVFTKVTFDREEFDTNNNYDTSTSRFTPTVAGYYQINWNLDTGGVTTSITISDLYKNGSSFKRSGGISIAGIAEQYVNGSALVYANGTTDYFEIYVYIGSGSTATVYGNSIVHTFFQGILVKAT